jgi:hypothetical protein
MRWMLPIGLDETLLSNRYHHRRYDVGKYVFQYVPSIFRREKFIYTIEFFPLIIVFLFSGFCGSMVARKFLYGNREINFWLFPTLALGLLRMNYIVDTFFQLFRCEVVDRHFHFLVLSY